MITDITEVIEARTSVRRYVKGPSAGRDVIERLVRLGMRAPSPKNRQPWKVIHITGETKDRYVQMGMTVLHRFKEEGRHYGSLEISLQAMETAGDLLFVYNPYDTMTDYQEVWEKSDLQAIGAFVEHILLGAKAEGLGTLWMNDVFFMQQETRDFFQLSHDIQAVISVGVPDEGTWPRPRKELEDVLFFG